MSWYLEDGKDSDVVISSRIRLARNIEGVKFVKLATDEEQKSILKRLKENKFDKSLHFVLIDDLDEVLKNL